MNIPQKFYVARQKREEGEILAFLVVADKEHTKAFQSSKDRADQWAVPRRWDVENKNYALLESIYVDNKPKTGFSLVTNISRYSTSNVVWRIRHPEGFEFEITSDNLADLLDTNTMAQGVFQEELFFTNTKKLVSTKTKLFASMIEEVESKKEHEVKTKELPVGTIIDVVIPPIYEGKDPTNYTFIYCGQYHSCISNKNRPMTFSAKSAKRFVVREPSTGMYYALNALPANFTVTDTIADVESDKVISEFNEQIRSINEKFVYDYYVDGYIPSLTCPLFISDKSYKYSDLKVVYEEVYTSTVNSINYNKIYKLDNNRIFGFYFKDKEPICTSTYASSHFMAEYRSGYEYQGSSLITAGFVITEIIRELDNGVPDVGIALDGYKQMIGWNGAFNNSTNQRNYVKMPEKIQVGRYVLGE